MNRLNNENRQKDESHVRHNGMTNQSWYRSPRTIAYWNKPLTCWLSYRHRSL